MMRKIFRKQTKSTPATNVVVSPTELTPKIPVHEKAKNIAQGIAPGARKLNRAAIAALVLVILVIPLGKFVAQRFWCSYLPSTKYCLATASVTTASLPSGSFVSLGTNTFASQQSTSTGKIIATLMPWDGKIYMGYGDYGANTGPVHIVSYDPVSGDMNDSLNPDGTSFMSSTEAVYNFRAINGALYALALDPKGSQCGFMYAKTTDGIHWQDIKNLLPAPSSCPPSTTGDWVDAEHVMDMNTLNGTDLWAAGSSLGKVNVNGTLEQGISGAVWHSTDGGATWTKMLESQPMDYLSNTNDYTRYYSLGALSGKMYTEAWDVYSNSHQTCQSYDGVSWSSCPAMLSGYGGGWRPIVFDGKLVFRQNEPVSQATVQVFDGAKVSSTSISAYDIAEDEQGKTLYALSYGAIYATTDLTNWTRLNIANLPIDARSIAVANNILYVGTGDSQLFATSLLPPVGPTASFYFGNSSGSVPLSDTLYANGSTGGTSVITNCAINFGDGTNVNLPAVGLVPHTYTQPGTYTATVTVTDANGLTATSSHTLTVTPVPSTPSLTLSNTTGTAALSVTADASASTAGTYPIADYMFDFGDGTTVGPQVRASATHVYTKPGSFVVTLTVRDTSGNAQTTTKTVNVTASALSSVYVGQYYPTMNLTGTPITRRDPGINFNWGSGSPMSGIPADRFSVRWTRAVPLDAGSYKFTTTTDDGVRLYIDNALVINHWVGESATTYTYTMSLAAGNHTIRMEYFEYTGGAIAKMSYALVSRTIAPFVGQYFTGTTPIGAPKLTRADAAINFSWGAGSPDPSIPADNFSARWTQTPYFGSGTYRFQTTTDDGVRLYIDNQLVIDHWLSGGSTNVGYKLLTAGYHTVRMEYVEYTGTATAQLGYYLFDSGNGYYQGSYWKNASLSGSPSLTRSDASVNFNWGTGAIASGWPVDYFSARWTKIANFTAGDHTFTTTTDDGVRLYIDDALVINQWKGQSATTYKVTKTLTAGPHYIRMEYFEGTYTAKAVLSYN